MSEKEIRILHIRFRTEITSGLILYAQTVKTWLGWQIVKVLHCKDNSERITSSDFPIKHVMRYCGYSHLDIWFRQASTIFWTTPFIVVVAVQPRCWVVCAISANGCDPSLGRNNRLSITTYFFQLRSTSAKDWATKSSSWFCCPVAIIKSFGSSSASIFSIAWTYSGAQTQSRLVERLPK